MSIFNPRARGILEEYFSRDDITIRGSFFVFMTALTAIGSFKGAKKNKKMFNLVTSTDDAASAWRKIENANDIDLTAEQKKVVQDLFRIIEENEKQNYSFMKKYIDAFDERSRLTIVLVTLFWVIVVITSVIFFIGLIFGFIYAIKAEAKEETWSNWRVLKRSFLGFGYVAIYWNTYGYW